MTHTLEQKALVLTEKQMNMLLKVLKHSKFTGMIDIGKLRMHKEEAYYHLFITLPDVQGMIGYIGSYIDDVEKYGCKELDDIDEENIKNALELDAKFAELITW